MFTDRELKIIKKLNTPAKLQDFLNSLKINFEKNGETCMSPRMVIKTKKAHCMEGALLAAAVLEFYGEKPLVLDLRANSRDMDHVVALFKRGGFWGAVGKTNHAVLRYREPIYKTIRELALSYFHEYFDQKGRKNLREYSRPFNLRYFNSRSFYQSLNKSRRANKNPLFCKEGVEGVVNWRISEKNLFFIPKHLDKIKHYEILNPKQIRNLRKADKIEIRAGELVECKK